jgi:glutamate formiminotransferase
MTNAKLVECVPNVSEGRRRDVIERLSDAAASVAGARLVDVHSDADHHRSVFTIVGGSDAVEESVLRLAAVAIEHIDLRQHRGVHPRIGALDVVPFVPLAATPMSVCVQLAHRFGRRLAEAFAIPVYFYGEAALLPERRRLADIRRGQFEGLTESLAHDPGRAPDVGPNTFGPSGATAVGARQPLIAFNIWLRTSDLAVGEAIARAVRASSGGLPGVQALAFTSSRPGMIQVSLNLTDLAATPLHVVVAKVHEEARCRGVEPAESELVGLAPASAVLGTAAAALGLPSLETRQVLELAAEIPSVIPSLQPTDLPI